MATSTIFGMFAQSPLGPLQGHMAKANECAQRLKQFFEQSLNEDWQHAEQTQTNISKLEQEADDLKRDLRLHLPKSLFLPVPRTDLLQLLQVQDEIANTSKDIAGVMIGRHMQIPDVIAEDFVLYLESALDACNQAKTAISELDELLETGFKGAEVKLVNDMINRLDTIEKHSDELQVKLRRKLFELEKDLPPIDTMFLYKVIDLVGELADDAQHVGARLQILLAV